MSDHTSIFSFLFSVCLFIMSATPCSDLDALVRDYSKHLISVRTKRDPQSESPSFTAGETLATILIDVLQSTPTEVGKIVGCEVALTDQEQTQLLEIISSGDIGRMEQALLTHPWLSTLMKNMTLLHRKNIMVSKETLALRDCLIYLATRPWVEKVEICGVLESFRVPELFMHSHLERLHAHTVESVRKSQVIVIYPDIKTSTGKWFRQELLQQFDRVHVGLNLATAMEFLTDCRTFAMMAVFGLRRTLWTIADIEQENTFLFSKERTTLIHRLFSLWVQPWVKTMTLTREDSALPAVDLVMDRVRSCFWSEVCAFVHPSAKMTLELTEEMDRQVKSCYFGAVSSNFNKVIPMSFLMDTDTYAMTSDEYHTRLLVDPLKWPTMKLLKVPHFTKLLQNIVKELIAQDWVVDHITRYADSEAADHIVDYDMVLYGTRVLELRSVHFQHYIVYEQAGILSAVNKFTVEELIAFDSVPSKELMSEVFNGRISKPRSELSQCRMLFLSCLVHLNAQPWIKEIYLNSSPLKDFNKWGVRDQEAWVQTLNPKTDTISIYSNIDTQIGVWIQGRYSRPYSNNFVNCMTVEDLMDNLTSVEMKCSPQEFAHWIMLGGSLQHIMTKNKSAESVALQTRLESLIVQPWVKSVAFQILDNPNFTLSSVDLLFVLVVPGGRLTLNLIESQQLTSPYHTYPISSLLELVKTTSNLSNDDFFNQLLFPNCKWPNVKALQIPNVEEIVFKELSWQSGYLCEDLFGYSFVNRSRIRDAKTDAFLPFSEEGLKNVLRGKTYLEVGTSNNWHSASVWRQSTVLDVLNQFQLKDLPNAESIIKRSVGVACGKEVRTHTRVIKLFTRLLRHPLIKSMEFVAGITIVKSFNHGDHDSLASWLDIHWEKYPDMWLKLVDAEVPRSRLDRVLKRLIEKGEQDGDFGEFAIDLMLPGESAERKIGLIAKWIEVETVAEVEKKVERLD